MTALSLILYGAWMAGKKSDLGPTGIDLTHNVRRRRDKLGLSYNELSRRLAEIGRDIPPLGLRRIEAGTRRVDVDDLMALAVVLGVSPVTLLAPTSSRRALVTATGTGKQPADKLWFWLCAEDTLKDSGLSLPEFWLASWPEWRHDDLGAELQERKLRQEAELARRRAARGKARDGDD